ncbi:DUF5979 domain-containing protein [Leucobacter iarius]|uniref:DUF5979 domain-containing protein n=1 Tax=Leucobacter iarius TaxID=333963 RepID=A0ABN2L8A6_9MICO
MAAEPTAVLAIKKSASSPEVRPGETLEYTVEVSCSTLQDVGCVNAVLTDSVPAEFEIVDVSVSNAPHEKPLFSGQDVKVVFAEKLDESSIGLIDNASATVTITVKLRDGLSYEKNGVEIPNTAEVAADNARTQSSTAVTKPVIELKLATSATKSFEPKTGQAKPGTKTKLTLGGVNESNAGVESLTLTDPVDPSAGNGPFERLAITGLSGITYPEGAVQARVQYFIDGGWVDGGSAADGQIPNAPPGVDLAKAVGVRVFFVAADGKQLPQSATGGIVLDLVQRENVVQLDETTVVKNTVESTVELGGKHASGTHSADYTIVTDPITVGAGKTFEPDTVLPGQPSKVTLSGTNSGLTPLDALSIREPAAGDFDARIEFTGFTSKVSYPQGADSGRLTLVYLDRSGDTKTYEQDLSDGAAFPALPDDFGSLKHFEVRFSHTGGEPIIAGAEARIEFGVTATDALPAGTRIDNVVKVTGSANDADVSAQASDTLTIEERTLEVETQKKVSPGTIWGVAGEVATIQLPTKVKERPASNTNAHQIVVSDPVLGADGKPADSEWWKSFKPTAITKTDVPVGATLTIEYFDTVAGEWKTLQSDVPGGQSFSMNIPAELQDRIGGLKFTFENTDPGFSPGSIVQPNITTELRQSLQPKPEGSDVQVRNCSGASAHAPGTTAGAATVDPCPEIEILAPTPGEYDLLSKQWIAPADGLVSARSGEHATSRLRWSTGGLSGIEKIVIADTRTGNSQDAGPKDALADTTFEAFDLLAVHAITAESDPLLKYDKIVAVELWRSGAWVPASGATGLPYSGSMPEIKLTSAEQASTTGVRLIVEENAEARKASTDPTAPTVGSGVARSNGNTRTVDLEWAVRDTKRSDDSPVLGSDLYNTTTAGDVNNIANVSGFTDGSGVARDEDSDLISILDRPLTVSVAKGWSGGPLGIPPQGTVESQYPSGRVTIAATNTTVAKVDRLSIVDPGTAGGGKDPFSVFDLKKIVGITIPEGAKEAETIVLLHRANVPDQRLNVADAKAQTSEQLRDVVGVRVEHNGRIVSGGKSVLTMDLRLRATHRNGGAPVTLADSPVKNMTTATVEDAGGVNGNHTVSAQDEAQIALANLNIGITTTKSFDPASQPATLLPSEPGYADEPWDPVKMTLSARPSGSARAAEMVVTDDTAPFWNAYRFVGFDPAFALSAPIQEVRVDALVGGVHETGPGNSLTLKLASWKEGSFADTPKLPSSVDPGDVQGLRFTFRRTDGSQWENPANPKQELPLLVKRRAFLASDGSTPVPYTGQAAAPGEAILVAGHPGGGHFTNTVVGEVTSAVAGSGSVPLKALHSTTAQVLYESGRTEVSVKKTPIGAQKPGEVIPFTLTVTNTAPVSAGMEKSILNPRIVDLLPTDAAGKPWLVFDPEGDAPRYAYAFQKGSVAPAAPNLPMTTDAAKIRVTEAPGTSPKRIEFAFPDGTVLMPGESYTITINMMFRPGIVANQHITNGLEVTAEEPFAFCNGVEGDVNACATSTEVYPTVVGALRGQKFVKADDDELGVTNVANPAASDKCSPALSDDLGAFYARDCVPITKPLHTETWREQVQNSGTVDMDEVVAIDRLPVPGDQGALALLPRGSQWMPEWAGALRIVDAPGYRKPDSVEFFTSDAADPCTADLYPASGTPCPPGAWTPLDGSTDPTSVKHVKAVFHFVDDPANDKRLFAPGDTLGYTFQTRTPASSPVMTSDTVAWNTIAIGAKTVTADGRQTGEVLPSEGRRVGVALATGPLSVLKTVTGAGAEFAPKTFEVQVECRVSHDGLTVALPPITATVPSGKKTVLAEQLPWGAKCSVVDRGGANGETSSTPGDEVTIGRDTDPVPLATLENHYDLTSFTVEKQVTGASTAEGAPVDYGSFAFEASCTFLGKTILQKQKEFRAGERWTLEGLPVGAECTVKETEAKGAGVSITVVSPGGETTTQGASTTVTLPPRENGNPALLVRAKNTFELAAIELVKQVDGSAAAGVSDSTVYEFAISCTWEGQSVFQKTVSMTKRDAVAGKVIRVDTLPKGARCTVAETGSGGATSSEVTPNGGSEGVPAGSLTEPVRFTAVNRYDAGGLRVQKEIVGPGADRWGTGPFEVTLECTLAGARVEIDGGASRTLNVENGYRVEYGSLPVGAKCLLQESKTGGATSSTVVDSEGTELTGPVEIRAGETPVSLRVINRFDIGAIRVIKQIVGPGAEAAGNREFVASLICTIDKDGARDRIEIPGGPDRTLSKKGGFTARYEGLPVGAKCELRETSTGGADAVSIVPNLGDSGVGFAEIRNGAHVEITVRNSFNTAPGESKPRLENTGSGTLLPWLGAAGALIVAGVLFLLRRRSGALHPIDN